nr:hypothetical protein EFAU004_02149 [Enterococcus faecium Aus0004]
MDKIFKIFVSSTFTDLEDVRLQAMQGVLKAGHMPIMMEGFAATATQKEIIKKKLLVVMRICLLLVVSMEQSIQNQG